MLQWQFYVEMIDLNETALALAGRRMKAALTVAAVTVLVAAPLAALSLVLGQLR